MKIISVAGDRVAILLDGRDSNGQYTVMESTLPPKPARRRMCIRARTRPFWF